jgi:adenosylcobinamide-phosphate synthase
MSAMAGALGVELEKVGSYRLGAGGHKPDFQDIRRAQRITLGATGIAMALFILWPIMIKPKPAKKLNS